jgi:putative ABC transport system permease protein
MARSSTPGYRGVIILLRIALRNLGRRGRKNVVIALLIAAGIGALFTGNAVLESALGGIQHTFSDNFTADISISQKSEQSFSIFGPDIPVIGAYESEPVILDPAKAGALVGAVPGVRGMAYVLSSPILVEAGGARDGALGLGVIGSEYFSLFSGLRFIAGSPPAADAAGWAVITEQWASKIAAAQGRSPTPGDTLQFSFFHNQTFTIRTAKLAGVIRYKPANDALDSAVILDARILRSLLGYSRVKESGGQVLPAGPAASYNENQDIDSLFSGTPTGAPGAGTQTAQSTGPVSISDLKRLMSEASHAGPAVDTSPLGHEGAWNFILIKAAKGAEKNRLAARIRDELKKDGFAVQVRDWRGTAGAVALYVYFLQIVLYVGLFMLGGIVLILTMNSVVMSVFERTAEIGTMRAIGARRGFIRGLFVVETSALTLLAGLGGVLLGMAVVLLLSWVPIHFTNQILILLFGGDLLQPAVSAKNIVISLAASIILGAIAWIYPVRLALNIQPVQAIHAS